MNCTNHPEREAIGTCSHCGKFFCEECLTILNGQSFCKEHLDENSSDFQQDNMNYQQPNYQQPNYQQPNYQQPNYQQPNYQQPNYQQPNYQQPNIIINNTVTANNGGINISPKSRLVAALLCLLLGGLGLHRFYVGKVVSGIIYIFTCGYCGIGVIVDLIQILCGNFRDSYGLPLKN